MDFEKLKRAAKETLKKVGSKIEDIAEKTDESEAASPAEEIAETKSDLGQTQRLDIKSVFSLFKSKAADDLPEADEDSTELENPDDSPQQTAEEDNSSPEPTSAEIGSSADTKVCTAFDAFDSKLAELKSTQSESLAAVTSEISGISADIDALKNALDKADKHTAEISDTLAARLNNTDSKLNSISNSLAGIAKLNDSIFDLKNSQMNTKNALGDLEANFYKLKRKMTAGVILISIITAIIAVLEIINLLS